VPKISAVGMVETLFTWILLKPKIIGTAFQTQQAWEGHFIHWKTTKTKVTLVFFFFTFCWPCIMQWFLVNDQRDAQIPFYVLIFYL